MVAPAWVVGSIVEAILTSRRDGKAFDAFRKDFRDAVVHSQPKWPEIEDLASLVGVKKSQLPLAIRQALRDVVTGRDPELEKHSKLLRNYLEHVTQQSPFEGMPPELRTPLQDLRTMIGPDSHAFDALLREIDLLRSVDARERRRLRFYTIAGFVVGLIGTTIGVVVTVGHFV